MTDNSCSELVKPSTVFITLLICYLTYLGCFLNLFITAVITTPDVLCIPDSCYSLFQLHAIDTRVAFNSDPISIDQWMLLDSNNTIFAFLSNDDGLLKQRKDSFVRHLYAIADESDVSGFKNSICSNIFHPSYMKEHIWPHAKYNLI